MISPCLVRIIEKERNCNYAHFTVCFSRIQYKSFTEAVFYPLVKQTYGYNLGSLENIHLTKLNTLSPHTLEDVLFTIPCDQLTTWPKLLLMISELRKSRKHDSPLNQPGPGSRKRIPRTQHNSTRTY